MSALPKCEAQMAKGGLDLRLENDVRSSRHGSWKLEGDYRPTNAWKPDIICRGIQQTAKSPRSKSEILREIKILKSRHGN